ncbi:hypothetical protein GGR57DRAFT_291507 [Xylariaceae sp. FL1272]|nr:hypothetical protein GGR57DRAFT_291507 [Xylariaceae sp. FL1272]
MKIEQQHATNTTGTMGTSRQIIGQAEDNTPSSKSSPGTPPSAWIHLESSTSTTTHGDDGKYSTRRGTVPKAHPTRRSFRPVRNCPKLTSAIQNCPIVRSLGFFGFTTIFGGSLLIFATVLFITYLWAGGRRGVDGIDAPYVWRLIAVNGWATRSVTLSSLLLRVVTAAQATVCSSLVAGLLIEKRQTPISQLARLSITRGMNSGPLQLILRTTVFSKSAMRFFCLESCLLVILAVVGLAVQFSSTILLSDFELTNIARLPVISGINYTLSPEAIDATLQSIASEVIDYQTFALFGEARLAQMTTPDSRGFYDGGTMRRSFLPLRETDRTSLNSIRGPVYTLSTRVSCMRPSVKATPIAFVTTEGNFTAIEGSIDYDQTFERAGVGKIDTCSSGTNQSGCWLSEFNTTIAAKVDNSSTWASSLFQLKGSGIDSGWLETPDMDGNYSALALQAWPFLLFTTNAMATTWLDYQHKNITISPPTGIDEWNSYEISPGIKLNATFCLASLKTTMDNTRLLQTANDLSTEPLVQTSVIPNVTEVMRAIDMLGGNVEHKTLSERRVLSIATDQDERLFPTSSNDTPGVNDDRVNATLDRLRQGLWLATNSDTPKISFAVCGDDCSSYGYHLSQGTQKVGEYVINHSGRPSTVIETFFTMAAQEIYYYFLPAFDVAADFESMSVGMYEVPRSWKGFSVVVALLVINLLCISTITAIFLVRSRFTRCGDVWHTVSQIISTPVLGVVDQCGNANDPVVREKLGDRDFLVRLVQDDRTGRITVERVGDMA